MKAWDWVSYVFCAVAAAKVRLPGSYCGATGHSMLLLLLL